MFAEMLSNAELDSITPESNCIDTTRIDPTRTPKAQPGLLLLNGLKYYRMEDYAKAKENLEKYSILQQNTLVMQILTKIYRIEGNFDKALRIADDLFIKSPGIEASRQVQEILLQILDNPTPEDPELILTTPSTGEMSNVKRLVNLIKSERNLDRRAPPSVDILQKALKTFCTLTKLFHLDWNLVLSDLDDLISRKHLLNLELHLGYLKLIYLTAKDDDSKLLGYIDSHLDLSLDFLIQSYTYLSTRPPTPPVLFTILNLLVQIAFKKLEVGDRVELDTLLKQVFSSTPILNSCKDGVMLKKWVEMRREVMASVELFEGYEKSDEKGLRVCIESWGDEVRRVWGMIVLRRILSPPKNPFQKIFGGEFQGIVGNIDVDGLFNTAITKASLRLIMEIVKIDLVNGKCRLQLLRTIEMSKFDMEGFMILLIITSTNSGISEECEKFWDLIRNHYGDRVKLHQFIRELQNGLESRLYQILADTYTWVHINTKRDCEEEVQHYKALVETTKNNKSTLFGDISKFELPQFGMENFKVAPKTKKVKRVTEDVKILELQEPPPKLVIEDPVLSSTPIKSRLPKPTVFANTPELLRSVPGFFPQTPIVTSKKTSIVHAAILPSPITRSPSRTPEVLPFINRIDEK